MVIFETAENALKYVKQICDKANDLCNSVNVSAMSKDMKNEIDEIKKDIVSFADFCRDVINKSGSYEAPSDWEDQKRYLDKLFKKLTDKMSMINNNTKNVPMNQGR